MSNRITFDTSINTKPFQSDIREMEGIAGAFLMPLMIESTDFLRN